MGVGGERHPDRLGRRHWESFAADLEITARTVVALVTSVAERCADAVAVVAKEFRAQPGAASVLQTLPKAITRRAQRLRRALAAR